MLSILAIFAWWYQGKDVPVNQDNNDDLLPPNFGRNFQVTDNVNATHFATNHEQLGRSVGHGIVQRVPVPRLDRTPPNRHRSAKSCSQSWIPGLPLHNQYIGPIIRELHQLQHDDYRNNIVHRNHLNHPTQSTIYGPL